MQTHLSRTDRRDRLGQGALSRGARLSRHLRSAPACWARAGSMATRSIWKTAERDRLREVDAALVHCPTSNTFIGSGLFDMGGLTRTGHQGRARDRYRRRVVLLDAAHDGRGLRDRPAARARRCIRRSCSGSPPPARPGRCGSADTVGRIAPGMEADLCVLDLSSTPAIAQRAARAERSWEAVFATDHDGRRPRHPRGLDRRAARGAGAS